MNSINSTSGLDTTPQTFSVAATTASAKTSPQPAAQTPPATAARTQDSVVLSSVAQAALKEATETPAQTAKEAGRGDNQARRLLARESAASPLK